MSDFAAVLSDLSTQEKRPVFRNSDYSSVLDDLNSPESPIAEKAPDPNDPKGNLWNSFKQAGSMVLDFGGGLAETVANPVGQFAASVPATVAGVGNQLFGRKQENDLPGDKFMRGYNTVMEPVAKVLEPQTDTGKGIQEGISKAFEYLPEKAGELAEPAGPGAAAFTKTGVSGLEMFATGKLMQGMQKIGKGVGVVAEKPKEVKTETKAESTKEPIKEAKEAEPFDIPYKPSKAELPNSPKAKAGPNLPEQIERAKVLDRVGIQTARKSSLSGDEKAAASDFQQSKLDNAGGDAIRSVLDKEKQALQVHTENIAKETGGTLGMAEDDLHARGSSIAGPFDSIRDVLNATRKKLYAQADEASGGAPSIKLDSLADFLKKDSEFEGKAANGSLRKGINSYLREQKILQEDGSLGPINAKSAEGLRKYINDQWSPETSGLAGRIKGLIDSDVLDKSENVYKPARDLHKKIKDTLENPSGLGKLMDFDPRNPVNRSVPYEKIPDFVTRLPMDQFNHVIKVLQEAPDEIKPKADVAIGEIKAHIVNKLLQEGSKTKGQWNAKGVSKILSDNSAKIKLIFTNEEIAQLSDLNKAGHILQLDSSYPGAAVQGHNLLVRGAMKALPVVGAAAGSYTGGFLGAAGGEIAGSSLAKKLEKRSSESSAKKRLVNISDMVKKEKQ